MKLQLENRTHVAIFALSVTLVVVVCNTVLMYFIYGPTDFQRLVWKGNAIAVLLAHTFSHYIGLKIVEVFKLTRELEHSVSHDFLTGLRTRADFFSKLHQLERYPSTIIVADIDNFKSINDSFGHAVGDEILIAFSDLLSQSCRETDLVSRFGGEEFVVLLRGARTGYGCRIAERLCRRVRVQTFNTSAGPLRVTASFGVAALQCAEDVDAAILRADAALYRAKENGRDQWQCAIKDAARAAEAAAGDADAA